MFLISCCAYMCLQFIAEYGNVSLKNELLNSVTLESMSQSAFLHFIS